MPVSKLYSPNETLATAGPNDRFLTSLTVNSSNEAAHLKWIATEDEQDFQNYSVIFVAGQMYMNVPITLTNDLNVYTVRVIPTLTTSEFDIEELYTAQYAIHACSAPTSVWHLANSVRMPLVIEFPSTYQLAEISNFNKYRWKFNNFVHVDPGHRREIQPTPYDVNEVYMNRHIP